MQEKRQPDHITKAGSKFWFKELCYWSNTTGYKRIYADDNGKLRMHSGKTGLFKKDIQELFRQWAINEAESVMIDGQAQTEKT